MKRILLALVVLFALAAPAFSAVTATVTNVSGNGASPSYSSVAVAGTLNGTTPVTAAFTVGSTVKAGSYLLLVTGGTDTQVLTTTVRPTACAAGFCSVFSGTATVGTDGATTTVNKVFAFPTSGITLGPGSYTYSIVSDGAGTGTVAATLILQSLP